MTEEEFAIRSAEIALENDLVKIGIPALATVLTAFAGSISAFLIARLKHRFEEKKEAKKAKLDAYREVIELVNSYSSALNKYFALKRSCKGNIPSDSKLALNESEIHFLNEQSKFALGLALLGLYGESEAQHALREYEDLTLDLLHSMNSVSDEEFDRKSAAIADARLAFIDSLSKPYALTEEK
ncbi:MAG: hypothetical protein Marn2KO_32410 [Marinobacter nauticus]